MWQLCQKRRSVRLVRWSAVTDMETGQRQRLLPDFEIAHYPDHH
jgi:hypothetical protein